MSNCNSRLRKAQYTCLMLVLPEKAKGWLTNILPTKDLKIKLVWGLNPLAYCSNGVDTCVFRSKGPSSGKRDNQYTWDWRENQTRPSAILYPDAKTDEKTWDPLQGLYQCKEVGSRQAHNSHTVLFGKSKVFLEFILWLFSKRCFNLSQPVWLSWISALLLRRPAIGSLRPRVAPWQHSYHCAVGVRKSHKGSCPECRPPLYMGKSKVNISLMLI